MFPLTQAEMSVRRADMHDDAVRSSGGRQQEQCVITLAKMRKNLDGTQTGCRMREQGRGRSPVNTCRETRHSPPTLTDTSPSLELLLLQELTRSHTFEPVELVGEESLVSIFTTFTFF